MSHDLGKTRVKRMAAGLAAALGIGGGGAQASVPVISILDCSDNVIGSTLRNALAGASSGAHIDVSACTSGITLTHGEITIGVSVTISGAAPGTTTIDANHNGRAFNSTGSMGNDALTLTSLTVMNGYDNETTGGSAVGGCIITGDLVLQATTVTDCIARSTQSGAYGGAIYARTVDLENGSRVANSTAYPDSPANVAGTGGGIYASGQFTCNASTISGNKVSGPAFTFAGGVFAAGSVSIGRCTIDSNDARVGGGALFRNYDAGETTSITNSTISGNHAAQAYGGIKGHAPLTISNSTIAFNSSAYCGGVYGATTIELDSSIIAGNTSDNPSCVDILSYQHVITGGANLVSVTNVDLPALTLVANPALTPLADHGGPTRTHALSINSPAIDAGSDAGMLGTDQRGVGFAREVVNGKPDIGAYERQVDDEQLFYAGFD